MVDSTNGPPSAAPTPICFCAAPTPNTTATKVTTLSGSAVPNAARIEPVACSPTAIRRPTHSTPFTNTSQAR